MGLRRFEAAHPPNIWRCASSIRTARARSLLLGALRRRQDSLAQSMRARSAAKFIGQPWRIHGRKRDTRHRRTYLGELPETVIRPFHKAGTRNR